VWLALSDDAAAVTGKYVEDEQVVAPSDQAQDDNLAHSLWQQSAPARQPACRRARLTPWRRDPLLSAVSG
jgi:hypothetical protein